MGLGLVISAATPRIAAARGRPGAVDALERMARGKLDCTALQVDYSEADALGGGLSVEIRRGKVSLTETRIGMADKIRTGALTPALCQRLVSVVLKRELWALKLPPNRGLAAEWWPHLRIGVHDLGGFGLTVDPRYVAALPAFAQTRQDVVAAAKRAVAPPKAAGPKTIGPAR